MSDKYEATVEVLTAEVRVLQVGRRQVTLSVVRQLDWADPVDVEPFGRVRTGDTPPGRVRAIGSTGSRDVKSATRLRSSARHRGFWSGRLRGEPCLPAQAVGTSPHARKSGRSPQSLTVTGFAGSSLRA